MTYAEMLEALRTEADLGSNASIPGFEDDELYIFLNKAQDFVFKKYLSQENYGPFTSLLLRTALDVEQHDLYNDSGAGNRNINRHLYKVDISDSTLGSALAQFIKARVRTTRSGFGAYSTAAWIDCMAIEQKDSLSLMPTPFNDPFIERPFCWIEKDSSDDRILTLLCDNDTSIVVTGGNENLVLDFVKYPDDIADSSSTELDEIVHQEIVDKALKIMQDIADPGGTAQRIQNTAANKNI